MATDQTTGQVHLKLLSSETKPTVNVVAGSTCVETDTDNEFRYNGDGTAAGWVQTSTGGAGYTHIASGMDTRGNYPSTWYLEWSGAAGAADNAEIYVSGDVSMYNYHTIFNNDNDENVDVHVSLDGTNFFGPVAVNILDEVGDALPEIAIAFGKAGVLKGKFKAIKILQVTAGAIGVGLVYGAHSVE